MFFSSAHLISLLATYKYILLFPLTVIEGPIVTVIASFVASLGYMNIVWVYCIVVVGDVVGDCLHYALGRFGGRKAIDRFGKYIGITNERVLKLEDHFKKHSGKTLVFGKLTHGIGGAILVAAGAAHVPFFQFVLWNFLATLPKSLLLVIIGFHFGKAYATIGSYMGYIGFGILALALVSLVIYFLPMFIERLFKKRKKGAANENGTTPFYLEKKSIDSGKGTLFYYRDASFPSRPWVVFLHGLSANHTTWLVQMSLLHERGYNSLALDMRGHGHSDKTKQKLLYTFEVFRDDLQRVVEAENIEGFTLVGYSFGGTVALEYALEYQRFLKGLILISTNHVNPLHYRWFRMVSWIGEGLLILMASILRWQGRKHYYYYLQGQSLGYWHSVWAGLNTMPLSINMWVLALFGKLNLKDEVRRIETATLIVRSTSDPFLTEREAQDIVTTMPKARRITIEHDSHFLASRAQHELSEIILNFLKK